MMVGAISIFLNSAFAQELFAPKEVTYDELEEGDIIPFDSKLSMDAFFPVGAVTLNDEKYPSPAPLGSCVTRSGNVPIKLYYCEDEGCLETETYDKEQDVVFPPFENNKLGFEDNQEIDVSNYQEVFEKENVEYIGWKVHFVDSGVLYWKTVCGTVAYDIYEARRIGNYQNIVLTPVTQEYVNCVNGEKTKVEHYMVNPIDIDDSSWYKDNVVNDYELLMDDKNVTSWEKPASFSFEADKGSKLVLTLKTDTSQLKITLDGKEQKLPDSFYNNSDKTIGDNVNPNRYYDYELEIPTNGKHTFQIEYLGDTELYLPYIYLKELKVLKPITEKEVKNYTYTLAVKTCPNGYKVKDYHFEKQPVEKVDAPDTLDSIWKYGLLLGFSGLLILVSYFVRKKVNS